MNKKKPSVTSLQKQVKELEEQKRQLGNKNYSLERDNVKLSDELKEKNQQLKYAEESSNFNQGKVEGINLILSKLQFDIGVSFVGITEDRERNCRNEQRRFN